MACGIVNYPLSSMSQVFIAAGHTDVSAVLFDAGNLLHPLLHIGGVCEANCCIEPRASTDIVVDDTYNSGSNTLSTWCATKR